jgi:hypothetical protein
VEGLTGSGRGIARRDCGMERATLPAMRGGSPLMRRPRRSGIERLRAESRNWIPDG